MYNRLAIRKKRILKVGPKIVYTLVVKNNKQAKLTLKKNLEPEVVVHACNPGF
jgi:hypothetical protein